MRKILVAALLVLLMSVIVQAYIPQYEKGDIVKIETGRGTQTLRVTNVEASGTGSGWYKFETVVLGDKVTTVGPYNGGVQYSASIFDYVNPPATNFISSGPSAGVSTTTGPNSPSGGTTTGPKISGITSPESTAVGGPAGSTTQPSAASANKFYYVAAADTILPDGTKLVKGQALVLDQDVSGNEEYDNLRSINADQYKFTQTYTGHYNYAVGGTENSVSTFSTVKQTQADNAFENYRTTTTVTITQDEQGNTHRTYDEQTTICGAGLSRCNEVYTPVPGSHITVDDSYTSVTKPTAEGQKGPPETRTALTERTTILYGTDSEGKSVAQGTMTVEYMPSDSTNPFSTRTPQRIEIASDGVVYYLATIDPNTLESSVLINKIDQMPGSRAEQDAIRRRLVETGALGFGSAVETYTFWQNAGTFIRAYNEYAGLRQLTAMIWPNYDAEVQARKERIQQQFCLAAGITNCVTSAICGSIYDISSDNVLAGRGPGGTYVSSAALNAERSLPIEVEGMTRQQLIDLFGNSTVIKGVWINLTDPKFDPKILGRMKLRLYHVQFSVTNNVEGDKDLHYNIVFKKVPQGLNSSYGIPVAQARWWSADQNATHLETKRDDIYKFSGTEYSDVCLTFDPSLPSGHAALSSLVDKLCVPFAEYAGGASDYLANPQAGQETPGAAPAASTPGALV